MAKLDDLRKHYRIHPESPGIEGDDATEDVTHTIVDVNGMLPDAQIDAVASAAKEMAWPFGWVSFDEGHFVIKMQADKSRYRLPFCKPDDKESTCVLVPYFNDEIAECLKLRDGKGDGKVHSVATFDFLSDEAAKKLEAESSGSNLAELSGLDGVTLKTATILSDTVKRTALGCGWPPTTVVATQRDIYGGKYVIKLSTPSGCEGTIEIEDRDLSTHKIVTLEIPPYTPK